MKQKFLAFLLIASFTTFLAGCVKTADGHSKAGVPFAKDKIYSRYARTVDQIMDASRVVLKENGQILSDDTANKSLKGKVNTRTVWIKTTTVTNDVNISEVIVQVRKKMGGGDIYLASELSKQIALQLATQ